MTWSAFFTHLLFAAALFALSCVICLFMVKRVRILDVPNERSSHDKPIPKSGGVVIVATFLLGVLAVYLFGDATLIQKKYFFGFFFASLFIAAISLYDDIRERPFFFKLMGQVVATAVVMIFGIVIHEITIPMVGKVQLGWLAYLLTFLWIVGLTNAYNFMDGLNGMAAGPAVITAFFMSLISFHAGSTFVYIICYAIIAGALGFMVFNFPHAKLFMGDVGSAFLGFLFANIAIIAALYDHSHTSFFVIPLLLFHYIFDTTFTFFRRLFRKENVFSAHREHLYQLFNRLGYSHVFVSCWHFSVNILQGIGAWYMLQIEGDNRILVFVPYMVYQCVYAAVITNKAREKGLI